MVVPILFTFDQSLEMAAGVCFTSLLENAAPETFYDIIILHGPHCDFSASRLNELVTHYGNCRLTYRTVEGEFVGGYEVRGIPETAYYRLLAPELIPEYDKILYSDVDVIIREDLSPYYQIDLGNNYFAGVDSCEFMLNPAWEGPYYYSGNLVINLELLRRDGLCGRFRELGKNDYYYQDMHIINIACPGRFYSLGPSFCLTSYLYRLIMENRPRMEEHFGKAEIEHALSSGIVHYNGPKPWNKPCSNADIWWYWYRRSLFFDEQFCHDFWTRQRDALVYLPFLKRLKLLLRYPIDRKQWKK